MPLAFAVFVMALAAVPLLGTNLVPDLSQGEFAFRVRLPEGTTLESNAEIIERVERRSLADGRFHARLLRRRQLALDRLGPADAGREPGPGQLRPADDARAEDEAAAIERVRGIFALFPNVEAELAHPSVLSVRPPLAVHLFSENLADLEVAAETTADMMWDLPAVQDVATSSEPGNPEITIELDRERADESRRAGRAAVALVAAADRRRDRRAVPREEQRLDIRLRASEAWRDRASEIAALRLPAGQRHGRARVGVRQRVARARAGGDPPHRRRACGTGDGQGGLGRPGPRAGRDEGRAGRAGSAGERRRRAGGSGRRAAGVVRRACAWRWPWRSSWSTW